MPRETDLFDALRRCTAPKLGCQIEQVHSFGLGGLERSFGSLPLGGPAKAGPSFSTIEKAMNLVSLGVGYFLGKEYKLAQKAFKLVYYPHFKVLKMFDKTNEKYWDALSYTRWILDAHQHLEKQVKSPKPSVILAKSMTDPTRGSCSV